MTSFETYELFLALKQHFSATNTYDYFKYNGKVKANQDRFRAMRYKYFYEKLAKKYNQKEFKKNNEKIKPKKNHILFS